MDAFLFFLFFITLSWPCTSLIYLFEIACFYQLPFILILLYFLSRIHFPRPRPVIFNKPSVTTSTWASYLPRRAWLPRRWAGFHYHVHWLEAEKSCNNQQVTFSASRDCLSQLEDADTLDRVVLYCQATVGLMMTELQKLLSDVVLIQAGKFSLQTCQLQSDHTFLYTFFSLFTTLPLFSFFFAVIAVSNFACGLYNRRLYDQAFTLVEILCKSHLRNGHTSLSVDRVSSLCSHIEPRL